MGTLTAISWTDHTFNPWWGCQRVSPGCEHCYAETFAKRTGKDVWGKQAPRRLFGEKHWNEPLRWNRTALADFGRPARVFCASMADVFEDRRDLDVERMRLWRLIEQTPNLHWQLLTKRPQNVAALAPWGDAWPPNVWLGTTVEDQRRADERIPVLLDTAAKVRFLSCEPLLGPLDLSRWLYLEWMDALRLPGEPQSFRGEGGWGREMFASLTQRRSDVDWVIVGGESGPRHRPLNLGHARDLRDQCLAAGVPFFFKQVGGRTPQAGGDLLDGAGWKQFPGDVAAG